MVSLGALIVSAPFGRHAMPFSDFAPIEAVSAFGARANGLPHCYRNATAGAAHFRQVGTAFASYNKPLEVVERSVGMNDQPCDSLRFGRGDI